MARKHESHTTHTNPADQRIPHSGHHGIEKPYREFDKTPLGEAHEMGYIETPDSPEQLTPQPDKKAGKAKKILAGLAGVAVIGGGAAVGVATLGGGEDAPSKSDKDAGAPANPGEDTGDNETGTSGETGEQATDTGELTVADIEIRADEYTSGEEVLHAYAAKIDEWWAAGGTQETRDNENLSMSRDDYIRSVTEPLDELYLEALYVPGWQNNPRLASLLDDYTRTHFATVRANIGTRGTDPEDLEPYRQGRTVTDVEVLSEDADELVVRWSYDRWDNNDQNRGEEFITEVDGITGGGGYLTFQNVDGSWKISDFQK